MGWEENFAKSIGVPIVDIKGPSPESQQHVPNADRAPKAPMLPKMPKATDAPKPPQVPGVAKIPKPTDVPGIPGDRELNDDEEVKMAQFSNDNVLRLVEAYIAGPVAPRPDTPNMIDVEHLRREEVKKREDHGQGDVKSKDDGRLKQNRDKEHKELTEKAVELEGAVDDTDGGARHEESDGSGDDDDKVQEPYERERVDHRAAQMPGQMAPPKFNDPSGVSTKLNRLPTPSEVAPPLRTNVGPLGKGLTPRNQTDIPQYSPQEQALRNHPKYGPHVQKLLGPNPADPASLGRAREKIKNMINMEANQDERDDLIRLAGQIAEFILKKM